MNVIAILAALGLEQWRAFHWRAALEQLFIRYARTLERKLNGGSAQQGSVAALAAVAPPVLVAAGMHFALAAVLGRPKPARSAADATIPESETVDAEVT